MSVTVTRRRSTAIVLGIVALLIIAAWAGHHAVETLRALDGDGTQFGLLFTIGFAFIVLQTILYFLERPVAAWPWHEKLVLDKLHVTVPVPVYNEDPELLRRCLWSLLEQERRPNLVYVVDDGSDLAKVDYGQIYREFGRAARLAGVEARWVRTANQGKRHAQGVVFADTSDTDIYVTVDSDALLDRRAIRELLRPFRSEKVQSVAGIVVASNVDKNWLTRLTDLWFVTAQLVTRSGLSAVGSVLVNSGPLAAYRAAVCRDNLDGYLNESFMGRRVSFSDDSMLTLYAKMRGRTVQQPSAVVLSAMPETVSHHARQYVRWMRGSFIRSCWRARYLPMTEVAFWLHALTWVQMLVSSMLVIALFVVAPLAGVGLAPWMLVVTAAIGLMQAFRYMTYRRSDVSLGSQLLTLAMFPLAVMWAFFFLRGIRWYGILTCWKTGWGTRQTVEVRAETTVAEAEDPQRALVAA
ncbi:glycosyltransferase [Pseudonocardia nantongensis]|uniref:glycosyltransferase n=1 Tax=Pseudonocardia nantongensis TaxID=1181885 RepID=UPI00397B28AB